MGEAQSATVVVQIAIAQLASFASFLLFAAGVHKLSDRARAARAVEVLTAMPARPAGRAAMALAAGELAASIALWLAPLRFDAALLAALIWGSYFVFLLQAFSSGRRDVDCGCSFGSAHRPLGAFQILRAAMLTLLGLVVALSAAVAPGSLAYDVSFAAIATQVLAGLALLALYAALDQLMTQQPLRAGIAA